MGRKYPIDFYQSELRSGKKFLEDISGAYSLTDHFNNTSLLPKKQMIVKSFDNKKEIKSYSIEQNYPNPFNPTTSITYEIAKAGSVSLKIYDILGSEVAIIVNEVKQPGRYTVQFDASGLSSGVYFFRISANDYVAAKKMIVVK